MARKTRNTALSLKEQLCQKPYLFQFVQAVRIIQALHPRKIPLGHGSIPEKEAVKLKSKVGLSTSSSDLFAIGFPTNSTSDAAIELQVNFLGIAGIQGPLPLPYTEKLLDRLKQKDAVFKDFLDIFNHRLLSLQFRVYEKFLPALSTSLPQQTPQGKILQSIAGASEGVDPFMMRQLLFQASVFWQKPHNPEGLRIFLQHIFQVPVQIMSFEGAWISLDGHMQTHLGRLTDATSLGKGAVLGQRAWCQHQGIRVRLKIKDIALFHQFLPTGLYFSKLKHLIASYTGPSISFKISLVLTKHTPSWLSKHTPLVLGWSSWLGRRTTPKSTSHSRDVEISFS